MYNGVVNHLVGKELIGFCEGYFGRDSYEDKVIIMNGLNWVVAISEEGYPEVATFEDKQELEEWVERNSNIEESATW